MGLQEKAGNDGYNHYRLCCLKMTFAGMGIVNQVLF